MLEYIAMAVFGALTSVLGIINMTGNVSSLHWYHRQRVTEENRKPFGRLVGIGTLLIGVSMILFSGLYYAYEATGLVMLLIISIAELCLGIVAGLILSFYAMIKYNGGIF